MSAALGIGFLAFGLRGTPPEGDARSTDFTPFDLIAQTPVQGAAPSPASPTTDSIAFGPSPSATPAPYDGNVERLVLPTLSVNAAVESIGIVANNQLDVPKNPLNAGWYDVYDKPGFRGNSVFSAHVDYFPDIRGPFYNLFRLEPGDGVVVRMDNGQEYRYEVVRKARYTVDTIPMGDLIWPKDRATNDEWITMITCGGRFVKTQASGAGEYLDRDVVVARRVDRD